MVAPPALSYAPAASLDGLPEELARRIVEHIAFAPVDRYSYLARQRSLYNVALVSRRHYAIANPLLWREVAVWLRDFVDPYRLSNALCRTLQGNLKKARTPLAPALGAHVRAFRLDGDDYPDPLFWAATMPNLRVIEVSADISYIKPVVQLDLWPRLEHASIDILQPKLAQGYVAHSLLSLDLTSVDIPPGLLTTRTLPSLRALAVHNVRVDSGGEGDPNRFLPFASCPPPDLLAQLGMLQYGVCTVSSAQPSLATLTALGQSVPLVLNFRESPYDVSFMQQLPAPAHLALDLRWADASGLSMAADILRAPFERGLVRSLWMSNTLGTRWPNDDAFKRARAALLQECENRGLPHGLDEDARVNEGGALSWVLWKHAKELSARGEC
ncbi:hypothetical protein JCM10450v2_003253 [Rhodotorula kratochvilovae]